MSENTKARKAIVSGTLLAGAESVAAAVALRNLKKHAEDAIRLIFASGCMVLPTDFSVIDPHSSEHAKKYFLGGPLKQFLRALKKTKTKTTELMHHLEALNQGDGDPEQGKLAIWTRYSASPAHPNHITGMMSLVSILDRDYDYIEACLQIINKRNYKENHPSPRSSSSAARRQLVSETTLSSPAALSQPRQAQSIAGSDQPSHISTESRSSVAHYKARIVEIKQDLLTSRIDKETTKELQKR